LTRSWSASARLTADAASGLLQQEKQVQAELLAGGVQATGAVEQTWAATDEPDELQPAFALPDDRA
jgi:hypothetical protein